MANQNVVTIEERPQWMDQYIPSDVTDELSEYDFPGGEPMGVVSIENKVWTLKYGKNEPIPLLTPEGFAIPYVDFIVVGANKNVTKTFYSGGYKGGDTPACSSSNGLVPDAGVLDRQNPTCGDCPHNEFNTALGDNATGKRCKDYKRLAVVPVGDIANEKFGGPMLLQIAPVSSGNFKKYFSTDLAPYRLVPHAVVTRMSFDTDKSGIIVKFQRIRRLEEDEMADISEWRMHHHTARILGTLFPPGVKPPAPVDAPTPAAKAPQPTQERIAAPVEAPIPPRPTTVPPRPTAAAAAKTTTPPPRPNGAGAPVAAMATPAAVKPAAPTAAEIRAAHIAKKQAELAALEAEEVPEEGGDEEEINTNRVLAVLDNMA